MVTHYECDYVEATSGRWGLGLKARLLAAGWFAGAACVPVCAFFLFIWVMMANAGSDVRFTQETIRFVWLFAAIPISAAALMGFMFGCQIVDPLFRTTAWRAALRGTLVAFLSYVLFVVGYGVSAAVSTDLPRTDSLIHGVSVMAFVFFIGLVLVGWLILIAGGLSGWLLYRVSKKHQGRFIDVPGESIQTAKLWIAVAILMFLANCVTLSLLVRLGEN